MPQNILSGSYVKTSYYKKYCIVVVLVELYDRYNVFYARINGILERFE